MDKFVSRFSGPPTSSRHASTSTAAIEEYGYALPLGKGIEVMPMPQFSIPSIPDVSYAAFSIYEILTRSCSLVASFNFILMMRKIQIVELRLIMEQRL